MRTDHGYARYSSHDNPCRCDVCRAAKAAYVAERRARRVGLPDGDARHGTRNGYQHYGCRCLLCFTAQYCERDRQYKAKAARPS